MTRALATPGNGDAANDTTPVWILRHHSPHAITALAFVPPAARVYQDEDDDSDTEDESDEEQVASVKREGSRFLLTGDAEGCVSLTDLAVYRPIVQWQAHKQGQSVLGVQMWGDRIVTHGRDNTVKVWALPPLMTRKASFATQQESSADGSAKPSATLVHEVNALNFCRFSLLLRDGDTDALLAVPHTLESGWIDVYGLPSRKRLYTAIGKPSVPAGSTPPTGFQRAAIAMSVHLFETFGRLAIFAGYEDGTLQLWMRDTAQDAFQLKWKFKAHGESVLSTAIWLDEARRQMQVVSTGADTRIFKATLAIAAGAPRDEGVALSADAHVRITKTTLQTEKPGRACSAFLPSSQDVLVGGWDGKARLYSEASDGSLHCTQVFRYHKESVQAVAAASNVIALGSKDGRVSLWNVRSRGSA